MMLSRAAGLFRLQLPAAIRPMGVGIMWNVQRPRISLPMYSQSTSVEQEVEFKAETRQLLDIVTHAVYTDKEVFLRELISNCNDALEKARLRSLTAGGLRQADLEFAVRIETDKVNRTITITDTGIGMTRDDVVSNLGTIARSGTRDFLTKHPDASAAANIIGKFGIGFYSAFMVSSKVVVSTQAAFESDGEAGGDGNGSIVWESDGSGTYRVSEGTARTRGTQIVLHLKEEDSEFCEEDRLRAIIQKHSTFINFPIYVNEQRVNTMEAIWMLEKNDISQEMHTKFYQFISNAYDDPLYQLYFQTDAPLGIRALIYVPTVHSEGLGMPRMETSLSLYCRKVLIENKAKNILPEFLRFMVGVVDCEDMPLSISRENMQHSALMQKLSKVITGKVLRWLASEAAADKEKFGKFCNVFGTFLFEGVCVHTEFQDLLLPLLRFECSASEDGQLISLKEYAEMMGKDQTQIYFLSARNREAATASAYYEIFARQNIPVLFTYKPIQDVALSQIGKFGDHPIISADSPAVNLTNTLNADSSSSDAMVQFVKEVLGSRVVDVRASTRLIGSPAIVTGHGSAVLRWMTHAMDSHKKTLPPQSLEINTTHPIVVDMFAQRESDPELSRDIAQLLYDNALLAAGLLDDTGAMLERSQRVMQAALTGWDDVSEAEAPEAVIAEKVPEAVIAEKVPEAVISEKA